MDEETLDCSPTLQLVLRADSGDLRSLDLPGFLRELGRLTVDHGLRLDSLYLNGPVFQIGARSRGDFTRMWHAVLQQ